MEIITKELLWDIVLDQHHLPKPLHPIHRTQLGQMQALDRGKNILIVSGIRRCGKSTLIEQFRQTKEEKDYYFNFDDERLTHFETHHFQLLLELFIEKFGQQSHFYFDEIQNIVGWERFIRRLHDHGYKIYITGSNATMLSKELGTHLTGRYIMITLYPISFSEFCHYHLNEKLQLDRLNTKLKATLSGLFHQYQKTGGFPEYIFYQQTQYLKSLYESIIYRDILVRYKIAHEKAFRELTQYALSNVAKEMTYNKLKNLLEIKNPTTIKDYFSYLENSFLLFLVNRFNYSLKKQLYAPKKIYGIDTALTHTIGFRMDPEKGRFYENLVFLELKRRGHDIYYHSEKKECDFVIVDHLVVSQLIQVTTTLKNPDTKYREIAGLIEAMQSYKLKTGLILTEDESGEEKITIQHEECTIHIMPIWKFLLAPPTA